jgi:hypothetical protein
MFCLCQLYFGPTKLYSIYRFARPNQEVNIRTLYVYNNMDVSASIIRRSCDDNNMSVCQLCLLLYVDVYHKEQQQLLVSSKVLQRYALLR